MFNWRRDSGKTVNLAIQGNGAHGAFTWGVLDRLLEEKELSVEGISGTSSGAVNGALVAYGLTLGGPDIAREYLETFWHKMADACHQRRRPWYSFDLPFRRDRLDLSSVGVFYSIMSRLLLAYDFNSTTMNPLRRVIEETIDFERLRQSDSIRLFVNATDVRTNKIKVFEHGEITSDAVCASACLPFLFEPVEIDGEHYWDGGFMGNPAIFPLIQHCKASDILLVQATPTTIAVPPTTASGILERISEISFTSTLMREMRAIAFINSLMDAGHIKRSAGMRKIRMHILEADRGLDSLGSISKFNADWPFLRELQGLGRQACERWLAENFDHIGTQSTVDLGEIFL